MIKVTSFSPFQNLRRITQEFYEEKALVKIKSLNFEREYEFNYKDVREVSDSFYAADGQITFAFWVLFFSACAIEIAHNVIYANPAILRIWQAVYISAWLLFITGFKRNWYIYFSDKNGYVLSMIKQTRKNRDLIPQILELIRKNSENIEEISATQPFPDQEPRFEIVDYNIPNMRKTTERFFENKIIGLQKDIYGESVLNIKYSQLNGQIFRGKRSENILGFLLPIAGLVMSILLGFSYGFGMIFERTYYRNIGIFLLSLFVLSFLLGLFGLIKREVIGFHNQNGSIAYLIYISRNNRDKVDEIIRFVKSKSSPEEINQSLKEQI